MVLLLIVDDAVGAVDGVVDGAVAVICLIFVCLAVAAVTVVAFAAVAVV